MAILTRREKRSAAIVAALQDSPTTAENLSRQLGYSIRTIYRDIHFMKVVGVPIDGEAGFGYMLRQRSPARGGAHG